MKDWEKNIPDGEKANANTLIKKELDMFEELECMFEDQNVWNKEHREHERSQRCRNESDFLGYQSPI